MITRYRVKKIGLAVACLILAGILYALISGCFSPVDFISYHKFLGKLQEKMTGKGKTAYSAEQVRQGITREVWYKNGTQMFKALLKAEEAEIAYEGIDTQLKLVEHLQGVKVWMQERLYMVGGQPMQSIAYFEAEHALYKHSEKEIHSENVEMASYEFPGHELNLNSPQLAQLTMSGSATNLIVKLTDKHVEIAEPKGAFYFVVYGKEKDELDFSADTLAWNVLEGKCVLNGNISAVFPGKNLDFSCDREVLITKGKQGLATLHSNGKTILTMQDVDKDVTLECVGEVFVDCLSHVVTMESIPGKEQLFFTDHLGKIYSDRAKLNYQEMGKKWSPQNAEFRGNVSVTNRQPPFLQQVIADKLDYSFLTREIDFDSYPNKRVLFYDQANRLTMSAKGLNVYKDKSTKKESIKGRGEVRLRFDEQEFVKLKKKFLLEKNDG